MAILMVLAVGKISSPLRRRAWPFERSSMAMPRTPSRFWSSTRIAESSFCQRRSSFAGSAFCWAEAEGATAKTSARRTAAMLFKENLQSGTDYTRIGWVRKNQQARAKLGYRNYGSDKQTRAY